MYDRVKILYIFEFLLSVLDLLSHPYLTFLFSWNSAKRALNSHKITEQFSRSLSNGDIRDNLTDVGVVSDFRITVFPAPRDIALSALLSISRGVDKAGRDMRYHLANDRGPRHERNSVELRMYARPYVRSIWRYTVGYTWDLPTDCFPMLHTECLGRRCRSFEG